MRTIFYAVFAILLALFVFENREVLIDNVASLFDTTVTTEALVPGEAPPPKSWTEDPARVATKLDQAKTERYQADQEGVNQQREEIIVMPGTGSTP